MPKLLGQVKLDRTSGRARIRTAWFPHAILSVVVWA
jgi:hypothetical protein